MLFKGISRYLTLRSDPESWILTLNDFSFSPSFHSLSPSWTSLFISIHYSFGTVATVGFVVVVVIVALQVLKPVLETQISASRGRGLFQHRGRSRFFSRWVLISLGQLNKAFIGNITVRLSTLRNAFKIMVANLWTYFPGMVHLLSPDGSPQQANPTSCCW